MCKRGFIERSMGQSQVQKRRCRHGPTPVISEPGINMHSQSRGSVYLTHTQDGTKYNYRILRWCNVSILISYDTGTTLPSPQLYPTPSVWDFYPSTSLSSQALCLHGSALCWPDPAHRLEPSKPNLRNPSFNRYV